VIVVMGRPEVAPSVGASDAAAADQSTAAAGTAAAIAVAIAQAGVHVELVGSIGDDPEGDVVTVALGRAGVGHAALLRDPAARTPRRAVEGSVVTEVGPLPRLDADDIALGLRYVPACEVLIVVSVLDGPAWAAAMEGAAYHGASVIAVVGSADEVTDVLAGAIVLLAPDPAETPEDDEAADASAFEAFVAGCAIRIARGISPEVALAEAVTAGAWQPSGD
jgi:sugar/nucleoside kinase (ribokinase family)